MYYSVTGATGLLGNNIVRELVRQGHQVRASIRNTDDRRCFEGLEVDVVTGDLTDPQYAIDMTSEVDGVFHAAGVIWFGPSRLQQSLRVNVDGSKNLARQAAARSIRMVYVSSVDALATGSRKHPATESNVDPPKGKSAYVKSKRAAERMLLDRLRSDNLDVVIVNPGLLLGPYDWKPSTGKMLLAVADGYVPLCPRGGVSAVDVRRVAAGTVSAMEKGVCGQRYILAGENISYLNLMRRMAQQGGRKGPFGRMGPAMAWVIGKSGDLFNKVTGHETNINSGAISIGQKYNYYDSGKAIKELGYETGSLDIAIADSWQWMVENGYTSQ